MECNAIQCSAVQCSAVHCSAVQCITVQCFEDSLCFYRNGDCAVDFPVALDVECWGVDDAVVAFELAGRLMGSEVDSVPSHHPYFASE